jgi:hypothetical protein
LKSIILRNIISFIAFFLVLSIISFFQKDNAKKDLNIRILDYSIFFKAIIISLSFILFLPIIILHNNSSLNLTGSILFFTWVFSIVFLLNYITFFNEISYDEEYIYVTTYKKKKNKIHWSNLKKMKHSSIFGIITLEFENNKIHIIPLLNGYKELKEFLAQK